MPRQGKETGVHGKVVEDGREWASLLESVDRDRDVMRSNEDRFGNDVAEKGAEGVGGPGRETDQAEEGEEVVPGYAVVCTLEVMEEEMVWLVGLEPGVESVIHLLNILLDALAEDKSALRLLKQLSQTGRNRGSKDIHDDPVVRVGD